MEHDTCWTDGTVKEKKGQKVAETHECEERTKLITKCMLPSYLQSYGLLTILGKEPE